MRSGGFLLVAALLAAPLDVRAATAGPFDDTMFSVSVLGGTELVPLAVGPRPARAAFGLVVDHRAYRGDVVGGGLRLSLGLAGSQGNVDRGPALCGAFDLIGEVTFHRSPARDRVGVILGAGVYVDAAVGASGEALAELFYELSAFVGVPWVFAIGGGVRSTGRFEAHARVGIVF